MFKKKFLSAALAFSMAVPSFCVGAEEISFSDLPAEHWAYSAVMQLVSDGTVSGMGDGTYAPGKLVTRAEFARMIGKTDTVRETEFADINSDHWGYEYVMWSGIDGDENNNYHPDEPMLRGDVIYTLWKRAGSPSDVFAPSAITSQAEYQASAAWGYSCGLMIGDDGLDLRLDEGISRAEVASIIVRAKTASENAQNDFCNTVSDEILKNIFETSGIFDSEYDPEGKITNGEAARAAMRIASEAFAPNYSDFTVTTPFEHAYVKDLSAMANACIGEDKLTAEFTDKNVTNSDLTAMLTFAFIRKSNGKIVYDTSSTLYKDVTDDKTTAATCLSFACGNGIGLYADNTLKPEKESTMKEIAAILLQLDKLVGSMTYFEVDEAGAAAHDISINSSLEISDVDKDFYPCVLEGLPLEVYSAPFMGMENVTDPEEFPKGKLYFARDFNSLFTQLMVNDAVRFKEKGIEVKFTFYPSLVANNGSGFTVRIKTEIVSLGENKNATYGDAFTIADGVDGSVSLHDGMVFYNDAVMPYELGSYPEATMTFGEIICIEK